MSTAVLLTIWGVGVVFLLLLTYFYEIEYCGELRSDLNYPRFRRVTKGQFILFCVIILTPIIALVVSFLFLLTCGDQIKLFQNIGEWLGSPLRKQEK